MIASWCDRQCGEADDKLASVSAYITTQLYAKSGLCSHPSLQVYKMALLDQIRTLILPALQCDSAPFQLFLPMRALAEVKESHQLG